MDRNRRLLDLHGDLPSILSRRSVYLSYRGTGERSVLEGLENVVWRRTKLRDEKREDLPPRDGRSVVDEGGESCSVRSGEDLRLGSDLLTELDVPGGEERAGERG